MLLGVSAQGDDQSHDDLLVRDHRRGRHDELSVDDLPAEIVGGESLEIRVGIDRLRRRRHVPPPMGGGT